MDGSTISIFCKRGKQNSPRDHRVVQDNLNLSARTTVVLVVVAIGNRRNDRGHILRFHWVMWVEAYFLHVEAR